jgi:class 3 adenylate cyclase/tetratricopeptide (TPR) repeat protein
MNIHKSGLSRETATIAFVDVVESVCLMAVDEEGGIHRLRTFLHQASELVAVCQGRVMEQRGDGLVLAFARTHTAIQCMQLLHDLARRDIPKSRIQDRLRLRAGLHRCELLNDGHAIYGAGVNLAARIAAQAQPGETLLSSAARDELNVALDGCYEDLGLCWLKHFEEPVRLFRHRSTLIELPADIELAISTRMQIKPTLLILVPESCGATGIGLGDIAADQLTRCLSRSSVLHVISPLSARALKGRDLELAHLFRTFRADYILKGVQSSATQPTGGHDRVRLELSLWRRHSPQAVWEGVAQGLASELLDLNSDLLGRTVHELSHCMLAVEQRAAQAARALPNLSSHTLYLSAVDLLHRFDPEAFSQARMLLEALRDRVPRHAAPLAWLARWHVFRVVQGWSDDSRRDSDQALYFSERALDRDPSSALALTMAGSVHAGVRGDAATAQSYYAQALASDPNDSLAWLMSGVAQGFLNAQAPALAASEMALGLAPADPIRHYYDALAATASLRAGAYERCIALAERAITAHGLHGTAYRSMAIAQIELGRHADAAETMRRLMSVEPHFTVKTYLARVPSQDQNRERFAELLRQAGLPES